MERQGEPGVGAFLRERLVLQSWGSRGPAMDKTTSIVPRCPPLPPPRQTA